MNVFCATLQYLIPGAQPRPGTIRLRHRHARIHRKRWHQKHKTRLQKARAQRQRLTRLGTQPVHSSTQTYHKPNIKYKYSAAASTTPPARLLGGATHVPSCHPDEALWEYYVIHAHQKQHLKESNEPPYKVLTQQEFETLPKSKQHREFARLGFQFTCPAELLLQLLPLGAEISKMYTEYELPAIQVPYLTLQEALCHTRILHSQLTKLTCRRKQLQREMANLNKLKRLGSNFPDVVRRTKQAPMNNTQLTLELYRVRHVITQHRTLLEAVQKRHKASLRNAKRSMPKELRIPIGHVPYSEAEDTDLTTGRPRITWTDVHKPPNNRSLDTDIEVTSNTPNPLLHRPPILDPLSAMEQLMTDLNFHGPVFANRAQGKPFDVIGGYKGLTQSQCTLSVGTLNVAGLDDYKLDMSILLMMQSSIDIIVLTDTQHTTTSAAYYKKMV